MLPFSPDGQFGLMLVIIAIQIMALGNTPLGQFKRTWGISIIGISFAMVGIFSCIVPGVLTGVINMLIGALNISGGMILLAKQYYPMLRGTSDLEERSTIPPILRRLFALQTVLYVVGVIFGITMLIPNLVPGLVIAGILVVNGALLLVLANILRCV